MKKKLLLILLFVSFGARAQLVQSLGKTTNTYNMGGKWNLVFDPPNGDSSLRIPSTGWVKRNGGSGGSGSPGGSNGDVQIKSGSSFAGSLLNQTALKMTYLSDSFWVYKSVANPNQFQGVSFQNSTGADAGGFKINHATGENRIGTFTAGYNTEFFGAGSEVMRIYPSGLNILYAGQHGEALYVNGQFYATGLSGIGIAPAGGIALSLPAGTASVAPLNIKTTSAALTTVAVAGNIESLVDSLYWTGNSGARYKIYPQATSSAVVYTLFNGTANATVTNQTFIRLADLTGQANRTITLPSGITDLIVKSLNTSGFTWTFAGATVLDFGDNAVTTLNNSTPTTYHLKWDGSSYNIVN
jgi:hypothetical protein